MSLGFRLLTPGNPKTAKGQKLGYWTFILHLAPASLSGFNVCPMATQGCKAACLNTAGRGGIATSKGLLTYAELSSGEGRTNHIQKARIRRTRRFFEDRAGFMLDLVDDIIRGMWLAKAAGFTPVFRLNGTSDLRWESIPVAGHTSIMAAFSSVQFYDYTKIANRKAVPSNYSLTFSLAEDNDAAAVAALHNGMNVAAVFRSPATVAHYGGGYSLGANTWWPVVVGDETDLRFLDERGVIVGLYAKGHAKKDTSGFVRD